MISDRRTDTGLDHIRRRFGAEGIANYVEAYGRVGAITDDTQLTLFTAEGLVRAFIRARLKGICHTPSVVHHAYLRFLLTQGMTPRADVAATEGWPGGWLIADKRLWARRAPGNTCLDALGATVKLGDRAENLSKGCGAIMRVAPVGLIGAAGSVRSGWPTFELGDETAQLTHGHPTGHLAAGYFAEVIAQLTAGQHLTECDVIWDQGRLYVRRSHSLGTETMRTTEQKRRYAIDLPPEAIDVLRWHVATQLTTPEQEDSDLLFPATTGGFRTQKVLNVPMAETATELGITKHLTQRALRRTFNDLARAAQVNDLVTRSISGHLTEQMQHHYSTVNGAEQRAALAKVIRLVDARPARPRARRRRPAQVVRMVGPQVVRKAKRVERRNAQPACSKCREL